MRRRFAWVPPLCLAVWVVTATGCATVHPYEREHLADPTMAASVDALEEKARRKLHTAREVAGGGEGAAAGGGCACGN